jgi:hypothetical protein
VKGSKKMSNKNTFDGLRFRILETLEKQPGQAPLTALEIAARLHATEYRDQMQDNVNFKVSRAVHSMKELGQIVVADARDKEGRLSYQLPHRLKFPPKTDKPPVNPALKAEDAEKIRPAVEAATAARKAAEPRKVGNQRVVVPGIYDKIVDYLNQSEHPLTTNDLVEALGPLYGGVFDEKHLKMLFAGHMHHLSKVVKRVQRRRVTGYGQSIQYEYYTRRTGKNPHPAAAKNASQVQAEPVAPVEKLPIADDARGILKREPIPQPRSAGAFRPRSLEERTQGISLSVPIEKHDQIARMAKAFHLSLNEFCIQAIDYALEHAEEPVA